MTQFKDKYVKKKKIIIHRLLQQTTSAYRRTSECINPTIAKVISKPFQLVHRLVQGESERKLKELAATSIIHVAARLAETAGREHL